MKKNVRKAIMRRNQIFTKWTKCRKEEDEAIFKDQKKLVRKQVKTAKKDYYHNLSDKEVFDVKNSGN